MAMKKTLRILASLLVLVLLLSNLNLGVFAAVPQEALVLTMEQDQLVEIVDQDQVVVLAFTAPADGLYSFWGENLNYGYESYIRVYDENKTFQGNGYGWGEDPYKVTVQMQAQQTYVLEAGIGYTNGESACNFYVSVTEQAPFEVTSYGDYVVITNCYQTGGVVEIPEEIGGLPVTGIENLGEALYYAKELRIPDSVVSLDQDALSCYEPPLEKLHLGAGLSNISAGMLDDFTNLKEITVSQNSTCYKAIDGVLYDYEIKELIAYPGGRTTTHQIPDSVEDIGVLFIGHYDIVHVKTGAGVTDYVTEDGVVYDFLKTEIFSVDVEKTGKFTVPETVYSIGRYGLAGCDITEVDLSNVAYIAYGAFAGCSALESIQMPDTLRFIDTDAFASCENLDQVHVEDLANWCEVRFYDNPLAAGNGELYMDGSRVTDLVLPSVVGAVYSRAFMNVNVESITIPSNIQEIRYMAFQDSACTQLNIEEGVRWIEWEAFAESGVKSVKLPDSLTELGSGAFYKCYNLKSVTFGAGMQSIYAETFAYTDLQTVDIPENILQIGDRAFYECNDLIWANMENDQIVIDSLAFYNCPIRNVDVGMAADEYGYWVFSGNNTASLYVPDGVTGLTYRSYERNPNMLSVTIPASVTSIDPHAFDGNDNIAHVLYKGTQEQWNAIVMENTYWDYPVYGCDELQQAAHIHFEATGDEIDVVHTCTKIEHYCRICDEKQVVEIKNGKHEYVKGICVLCGESEKKGWVQDGGKWFYYEDDKMVVSDWRKDSQGWVYLGEDGAMVTNQWIADSKGWCYVGADGYCETNTWKKDSIGWVYLDSEGSMVKNDWVKDGGKWYFLDSEGYMVSNQWRKDSQGWCYLGKDGAMVTNDWVKDSKGWCYVGADGYCVTNTWMKDSVGWVYLDSEGSMVYNKWIADSVGWCYVGADGYMVTNDWTQDSNGWCYMGEDGYCLKNTSKVIGGKLYYFDHNGNCTNP